MTFETDTAVMSADILYAQRKAIINDLLAGDEYIQQLINEIDAELSQRGLPEYDPAETVPF